MTASPAKCGKPTCVWRRPNHTCRNHFDRGACEEALRISEVRYEAGLATPVEVSDARVALTGARTNHVNAVYGYQLAQAQLLSTINASEEELGLLVPRSEDQ